MKKTAVFSIFSTVALSLLLAAAGPARTQAQSLASCGNIRVEAEAQCELVPPSAECTAMCTPITVEAACHAQLAAECQGECDASADVDCSGECRAECSGSCEVDPGKFDCRAECTARCGASCEGTCSAEANSAECEGACEATCMGECDASCDVELPEADCDAKCDASCEGSCEAEASLDCQIDCQARGQAACEVDVQGGCEADCETQEGALFCDGNYVDYGNNLEECAAAIQAVIDANIEGYAEGSSGCDDGTCRAEGKAGVSCSALPGTRSAGSGMAALLASIAALTWTRRRRAR